MKKEKSCGAVVLHRHADTFKVLTLCHKNGGHFSFPKGHVEPGETEAQTALREIREETGLVVALLPGFRHVVTYSPKPGVEKDVVYFLALAGSTDAAPPPTCAQGAEVADIRWLGFADAEQILTYQSDRDVLRCAAEAAASAAGFSPNAQKAGDGTRA